jgi:hypothetical protein
MQAMNLHPTEIVKNVAPGSHAALLVDQAAWHLYNALNVPANITIVPLPAKCPELNPQGKPPPRLSITHKSLSYSCRAEEFLESFEFLMIRC